MTKDIAFSIKRLEKMMATPTPTDFARNGWATLMRWRTSGSLIHQLTEDQVERARAGLPLDYPLVTASTRARAIVYQLSESGHWFALARHQATEPYACPCGIIRAFDGPSITYFSGTCGGAPASGILNLTKSPTPSALQLMPGMRQCLHGAVQLQPADIVPEVIRLAMCLPHFYFYGKPGSTGV